MTLALLQTGVIDWSDIEAAERAAVGDEYDGVPGSVLLDSGAGEDRVSPAMRALFEGPVAEAGVDPRYAELLITNMGIEYDPVVDQYVITPDEGHNLESFLTSDGWPPRG